MATGLAEKADQPVCLSLEISPHKTQVRINVTFQGLQIPEDITEVLLGRDFSSRTFGQDLRLSLARKIIESHRGRIEIERKNEQNLISVLLSLPAHP